MNSRLVREWLKAKEMKPEELAVKLGVSFSTVSKILRGHKPFGTTITVLAEIMGVPREQLLSPSVELPGRRKNALSGR